MPANRSLFTLLFVFCAALMGAAFYFQYVMDLQPCPLCMLQRGAVIGVGLSALIAALHNPQAWGRRVYALMVGLFAVAGIGFASRQLWLQSLPADQVPACVPSLNYLLQAFPLTKALQIAMRGTGDCAEVTWRFLGLSMPGWTLLAFVAMFFTGLVVLVRRRAQTF